MLALVVLHVIRQTAPITLTVRAEPVREVCAKLAEASHLRLTVKGRLGDEPLIVKLNQVPIEAAMAKIAEAVDAEWFKAGEGQFELTRTAAIEKREYADHLEARAAKLKEDIEKASKAARFEEPIDAKSVTAALIARKVANEAAGPSRYDAVEAAENRLPPRRLMLRLLNLIDPKRLAAIEPFGCEVFSSDPTKMEQALPGSASAALAEFRKERELVIQAGAKVQDNPDRGAVFSPFPVESRKPWDGRGFVIVKVARALFGDDLTAAMTVFDGNGKVISRTSHTGSRGFRSAPIKFPADPIIKFSPDSARIHAALTAGATYRKPIVEKPLDKQTTAMLLDPVHHDPLSYVVTDVFTEAADANQVNLVAQPDDFVSFAEYGIKEGKTTCGEFCTSLFGRSTFALKDGWLVVEPADRYETRLKRLDRSVMARYLKALYRNGFASLEEKLALAADQPFMDTPSFLGYYEMALGPTIRGFDGDRKMFRFYATLQPEQRSALLRGGSLTLIDLSPNQRFALEDWIFHSYNTETLLAKKENGTSFLLYESNGTSSEPTLAVGEGLLRSFRITATVKNTVAAICYTEWGANVMDPETLALNMIRNIYPDEDGSFRAPAGYREGQNSVISLQVRFDPNCIVSDRLNGLSVDMSRPMVSLDGLSEQYRSRYDKELAAQKALRQKSGAKPAGTATPPPPR